MPGVRDEAGGTDCDDRRGHHSLRGRGLRRVRDEVVPATVTDPSSPSGTTFSATRSARGQLYHRLYQPVQNLGGVSRLDRTSRKRVRDEDIRTSK